MLVGRRKHRRPNQAEVLVVEGVGELVGHRFFDVGRDLPALDHEFLADRVVEAEEAGSRRVVLGLHQIEPGRHEAKSPQFARRPVDLGLGGLGVLQKPGLEREVVGEGDLHRAGELEATGLLDEGLDFLGRGIDGTGRLRRRRRGRGLGRGGRTGRRRTDRPQPERAGHEGEHDSDDGNPCPSCPAVCCHAGALFRRESSPSVRTRAGTT